MKDLQRKIVFALRHTEHELAERLRCRASLIVSAMISLAEHPDDAVVSPAANASGHTMRGEDSIAEE
jgi:hypothetical protein